MKRALSIVFVLVLLCVPFFSAHAAQGFKITLQPQNYQYPEYAVAIYTVKVEDPAGTPKATWYMKYEGKTYNISQIGGIYPVQPWEGYAGENYGPRADGNTFTYTFAGIEEELDGAEIWCVAEDGHYDLESAHAVITVSSVLSVSPPEILSVPAEAVVPVGEELELRCVARSGAENVQLSYQWYETTTGKLQDVKAIVGEDSDFYLPETAWPGTHYYVCGVFGSNGGRAYSSVIKVTVEEIPGPKITTKTLPAGEVGKPYQAKIETDSKGCQITEYYNPGHFNDLGKSGLKLAVDGTISGTPEKAGNYTFTVCAANQYGEDYAEFTIGVKKAEIVPDPTQHAPATDPEPAPGDAHEGKKTSVSPAPHTGGIAGVFEEIWKAFSDGNSSASWAGVVDKLLTLGFWVLAGFAALVLVAVLLLVLLIVLIVVLVKKKKKKKKEAAAAAAAAAAAPTDELPSEEPKPEEPKAEEPKPEEPKPEEPKPEEPKPEEPKE